MPPVSASPAPGASPRCLLVLLGLMAPLAGAVLHVDRSATGTGDGQSWQDAVPDLQSALLLATPGDELWVAAGTYYPDEGGTAEDDDREATFALRDGVSLYGGFGGTELAREDRRPSAHPTILSGDLGQDDGTAGSVFENAYHVVTADGVGPGTVLDGFVVTSGNASTEAPHNAGGGLLCDNAGSPVIRRCVFRGNLALDLGGAVHVNHGSSPTFSNCVFVGNRTSHLGGAACVTNNSAPVFANCSFAANAAPGLSGYGGALYSSPTSTPELLNSICWDNEASTAGNQLNGPLAPTSTNNLVEGNSTGGAVIVNSDPRFVRNPDPGPDGLWSGPADNDYGDLDLQPSSPARNRGQNDYLDSPVDLADRSRLQFGAVDLGAYEVPLVLSVFNKGDSGIGTLRSLITALPAPGGATLRFDPDLDGQTISLTSGPLNLNRHVVIDGSTLAEGITIDAGGNSRLGEVAVGSEVVFDTLTLTGGRSPDGSHGDPGADNPGGTGGDGQDGKPGGDGGGILNHGTLILRRVTLHDNATGDGGHGGAGGSGSTPGQAGFGARSGRGGGICNHGELVVINSTLTGNLTGVGGDSGSGGGTPTAGAGGDGGGIYNEGTLTILHSTLTANSVGANGAGPAPVPGCGGGLRQLGQASLANSVLSENSAPAGGPDLDGEVNSVDGLNFVGDPSGATGLGTDVLSGPSLLGPLRSNGGPTMTCRPSFDSPLIDPAGADATSRLNIDQRGQPRVTSGIVDIGAVEALLSIEVDSTDTIGDGSLPNSLEALETGGVITFAPSLDGSTFILPDGAITLNKSVHLDASSLPSGFTLDGGLSSRILEVDDGDDAALSEVTLSNLTLVNGSSGADGGAIANRENLTLRDCRIEASTSARAGGAIWLARGTTLMERCTVEANSAAGTNGGGGLRLEAPASLIVRDSIFTANTTTSTSPSSRGGGALSMAEGSSLILSSTSFVANSSSTIGGALSVESADPSLTAAFFTHNSASEGGAVHLQSGSPQLMQCRFVENSATIRGGALATRSGASPTLANSFFLGNSAPEGGAGHHQSSSPLHVNCAFVGNSAATGGAVRNDDSSGASFTNCTIAANSASDGGGLFNGLSTPTLTHVILWANEAPAGNPQVAGDVDPSSSGNLIDNGSGPHVLTSSSPRFARIPDPGPDGDWNGREDNDYGDLRLISGSPALEAGTNAAYDAVSAIALDLGDRPRQVGSIDLGAYEGAYLNFAFAHPLLDPEADDNGNGLPNFVDYAMGGDPGAPLDSTLLPAIDGREITFTHRTDPAVDTQPTFEFSPDLQAWTSMVEGVDYAITSSTTANLRRTLTLELLQPLGGGYYRQRFGQAP